MTALAGHTPPTVAPVVVMQCRHPRCPSAGRFASVDIPAVRFAQAEGQPVLCADCRRPLAVCQQRPAAAS